MIRVWTADVSALLEKEIYMEYYRQVPVWRREKADKIKADNDKALSIGAWILLQKMREAYGVSEEVAYNLSHSGTMAMCALSDRENEDIKVGCDIEKARSFNAKLVERFFCESEKKYLLTCEDKDKMFGRFWVLKESFMKATQQGMKMALNLFEIKIEKDNTAILYKKPEQFSEAYYYREFGLENREYSMAVCSTDENIDEEIQEIIL